jgi:hypothetical protein
MQHFIPEIRTKSSSISFQISYQQPTVNKVPKANTTSALDNGLLLLIISNFQNKNRW